MKEFHIALSSPCVLLISLLIKTTKFVLIKAVCMDIYGVYIYVVCLTAGMADRIIG